MSIIENGEQKKEDPTTILVGRRDEKSIECCLHECQDNPVKRGKGKKKNEILNIKTDENAGHGTSDEIEQTKKDVKGLYFKITRLKLVHLQAQLSQLISQQ